MRDKLIFIGVAVAAVVIGVLVFLSGSTTVPDSSPAVASNQPSAVVVPFTRLAQGMQSNVSTRVNYLITSSKELSDLWKLINATSTPPAVDFKTNAVVAVFAGKASSTAISVVKIEDSNARLVSVTLTKPDAPCTPGASLSPYDIVAVPVTALPFSHKDVLTTVSCKD